MVTIKFECLGAFMYVRYYEDVQDFSYQFGPLGNLPLSECQIEEVHTLEPLEEQSDIFLTKKKEKYLKCKAKVLSSERRTIKGFEGKGWFPQTIPVLTKSGEGRWVVATYLKVLSKDLKTVMLEPLHDMTQVIFVLDEVHTEPPGSLHEAL